MTLMVQDLTNPMLAQIPHVQLAAHAGTIMGVETNGMQFYPEASAPEAVGASRHCIGVADGVVDCSTLSPVDGFGYRLRGNCARITRAGIHLTRAPHSSEYCQKIV